MHKHQIPETTGRTIPWAGLYDRIVRIVSLGKADRLRAEIANKAPYKPGDTVLDVGCGTGDQALIAKQTVGASGHVVGIDASPKMIQVALDKAAQMNLDISFQVDLIEQIPFGDEYFDVVMNSLVMHHLPDELKIRAIDEIHRVLKPGGKVYFVDMESLAEGSFKERFQDLMIHLHGGREALKDNVQQLAPLLQQGSFTDISTGRVNRQLAYIIAEKG
ncbi:MAG: class I SAM-dependent methyltransferase [Candidatus Marinimicrobia bacterium]|nr:class I SAM-dependent methyltransferase [Candidatus Neomarinimicrobiota bacterium]